MDYNRTRDYIYKLTVGDLNIEMLINTLDSMNDEIEELKAEVAALKIRSADGKER